MTLERRKNECVFENLHLFCIRARQQNWVIILTTFYHNSDKRTRGYYLMKCGYDEVYVHDMQFLHLIMIHKYDTEQ